MDSVDDAEATFGPSLPFFGLTGYLVQADPAEACSPIVPPPDMGYKVKRDFISVIRRSRRDDSSSWSTNCTFDQKVLFAQQAGYQAAVIYNVGSERIFRMDGGAQSASVMIPSVLVGASNGRLLADEYNYRSGYCVTIMPNANFNPSFYFLPFLVFAAASVLVVLVVAIARKCSDRRQAQRDRLTRADLNAFAVCKYSKTDSQCARFECCAICLEDYTEGDRLRVLPCRHAYHARCIDEWLLTKKRVCPVCKEPVPTRRETRNLLRVQPAAVPSADVEEDANERTPLLAATSQYSRSEDTVADPVPCPVDHSDYERLLDLSAVDEHDPVTDVAENVADAVNTNSLRRLATTVPVSVELDVTTGSGQQNLV